MLNCLVCVERTYAAPWTGCARGMPRSKLHGPPSSSSRTQHSNRRTGTTKIFSVTGGCSSVLASGCSSIPASCCGYVPASGCSSVPASGCSYVPASGCSSIHSSGCSFVPTSALAVAQYLLVAAALYPPVAAALYPPVQGYNVYIHTNSQNLVRGKKSARGTTIRKD